MNRQDRFPGEIETVTPGSALIAEIEPFYAKGEGHGRPLIRLKRMLQFHCNKIAIEECSTIIICIWHL